MSDFYSELRERGILKQVTDEQLGARLSASPLTLYAGFDPTADSLHVGSLLPLVTLRRFQRAGHRVIALVGGATGMIGDPSGKSQERSLQTLEQIARNAQGIARVFERFLDIQDPTRGKVANNADWFKDLSFIGFLRDVGKHFTVNHMVAKESVRARLEDREHGISYTEFSYMLLQAYDFWRLYKDEGCTLQVGGSDQWGNITAGTDLIRRKLAEERGGTAVETEVQVFGLTHPLVMKADGSKFGKTESGTVWLDASRTSPYAFYQFWIQTADADVSAFLRWFSFKPLSEIESLEASLKAAPEKRDAQRALAQEMTELVHGREALERAERATRALFSEEIKTLSLEELRDALQGAPTTPQPRGAALPLIDALVATGLCASKGAARKDVTAGGIYVNNVRASDPAATLGASELLAGAYTVLRKGKRTLAVLEWR